MGILTRGQYTFGNKSKSEISSLSAPLTLTGGVAINASSTTLNGTSTLFLSELFPGDIIRIPVGGWVFLVQSIASNTSLTVSEAPTATVSTTGFTLLNPKRIKRGDSVFNLTDRYPMYYAGDNDGPSSGKWLKGEFCNGQIIPIRNDSRTGNLLEGNVLQNTTSATVPIAIGSYSTPANAAIGVTYNTAYGRSCVPTAVCGIHNTDTGGTINKGEWTTPASGTPAVIQDSGGASSGACGIAVSASGTPAGEVEMLVNFIERL